MSMSTRAPRFPVPLGINDTNIDTPATSGVDERADDDRSTHHPFPHAYRIGAGRHRAVRRRARSGGTDTDPAAEAATPVAVSHDRFDHADRSGHDMARLHNNRKVSRRIELYAAMRSLWNQHMEWTWSTVGRVRDRLTRTAGDPRPVVGEPGRHRRRGRVLLRCRRW